MNEAAYEGFIQRVMNGVGEIGLEFLQDALDLSGSGIHWEGNPQASSAPGEYPVRQTGALLASLDARPVDYRTQAVGSFEDKDAEGYAHAVDLEAKPTSRGGRHFLEMAIGDRELQDRLRNR